MFWKGGTGKVNAFLEIFAFTKGVEYLIAITFIIAFIAFWQLVYGKRKGLVIKIALLLYLVLGFVIMVGSCLATRPQ